MTTLVRTRIALETLRMNQQPIARRRSKRLAAYDEEDGDFIFTRGSKRTKTAPTEPEPEPALDPAPAPRRSKQSSVRDNEVDPAPKKSRGRKMSFSTPKAEKDVIHVPKRGARKSTRLSADKIQNGLQSVNNFGQEPDYDSIALVCALGHDETDRSHSDLSKHSTVISLPFSDTPVINRNKELRKKGNGSRRSSLGLRGRRASSLIDSGYSAIPHREVETSEFYKHIEAEGLTEPRRMKQLLTWTGERALGEKPSHGDSDSAAILAARVITESLLKDFGDKSEFSDWFNREEAAPTKVIKKPNPRNLEFEEKIAELEPRVKRLREERDQWKALAKPLSALPELFPAAAENLEYGQIDAELLEPEQAAILSTISSSSALDMRLQASSRLKTVQLDLELKIDQFADGVHKLEQYQATAGRAADKILAISAVRLDERDRKEKEEIGTRDMPMQEVLRSLSRILPEGGSGR